MWIRVIPILFLLSACASQPPLVVPPGRQALLQDVASWSAEGRIALQQEDQTSQWGFSWRYDSEGDDLSLRDILGRTVMTMQQRGGHASLKTLEGQEITGQRLGDLLQGVSGMALPVDSLRYWLRGLPEPGGATVSSVDAAGRLLSLEQAGWSIVYPEYALVDGLDLPSRMVITGPSQVRIKIMIKQWSFAPEIPRGLR